MIKPMYLFHYTSEARLKGIVERGELKVSKAGLSKGEKPALWLSAEPVWDDSALKFRNFKDKEEQFHSIGLGRVVVPFSDHFVTYKKWTHVSGVDKLLAAIESQYFNQYDRSKWWASFKNISEADFLSVERWDGNRWEPYCESESTMDQVITFA